MPPPLLIGVDQTLSSVPSDAWNPLSCGLVFPAESVTDVVPVDAFPIPTSTTRRLPAVTLLVGVTARAAVLEFRAVFCCTKFGVS